MPTTARMLVNPRSAHVGPGGKNCACCYPAPRQRKAMKRHLKAQERTATRRFIDAELAA